MLYKLRQLNIAAIYNFSSSAPQLTDYQYISKIQKCLKQNNINEALKYLVNSHLDGKVLDVQIFRNYFLKAHQLKSKLSYEQIAYQICREYFKPNILLIDWMNSLTKSANPKILSLIAQDFKYLKIDMPKIVVENKSPPVVPKNSPTSVTPVTKQATPLAKTTQSPNIVQKYLKKGEYVNDNQKQVLLALLSVIKTKNFKITFHNLNVQSESYAYEDNLTQIEQDSKDEVEVDQKGLDDKQESEKQESQNFQGNDNSFKISIQKIEFQVNDQGQNQSNVSTFVPQNSKVNSSSNNNNNKDDKDNKDNKDK